MLSFIASMYIYHSARLVSPLLGISLVAINFKTVWRQRKKIILPLVLIIVILIPLVISFLGGGASSRFGGVGFLADAGPLWRANELRAQHSDPNTFIPTIFHNRYLIYFLEVIENYFSHFYLKWAYFI